MDKEIPDIITSFVAGMASFINPCIIALVPLYVAMLASKKHILRKTLMFSLGFLVVFVLLGIISNSLYQLILQHISLFKGLRAVIIILFGVFFIFSSLFDTIIIKVEAFIQSQLAPIQKWIMSMMQKIRRTERSDEKRVKNHMFPLLPLLVPFLIGILASLAWTPCVSPILGAIFMLATVASRRSDALILLISYGSGLLFPFLLTALFWKKIKTHFSEIQKVFIYIYPVLGFSFIVYGIYLLIQGQFIS